jgi:hypothetical protein
MRTFSTRAALSLLAVLALAGPVAAQATGCNWYADMSLKQQQQNQLRKCGFTGPEWSTTRQTHLAWCATQSPDGWKAQAQSRERQLATCKR